MFNSKIIKVDTFTSQKGKPCKVVWYSNEQGLPCRNFVSADIDFKAGDACRVSVEPSFDCSGRVVVVKA